MSDIVDWNEVDWDDLYPRVIVVAANKLRRLSWRGKRFGPVPGGKTAEDFVHDAIAKTLGGQREWKGEQHCSLFKHLVGIISSEISHLVTSPENRRTLQADENVIQIADHRQSQEMAVTALVLRRLKQLNKIARWVD
jgi:hypothetical protein